MGTEASIVYFDEYSTNKNIKRWGEYLEEGIMALTKSRGLNTRWFEADEKDENYQIRIWTVTDDLQFTLPAHKYEESLAKHLDGWQITEPPVSLDLPEDTLRQTITYYNNDRFPDFRLYRNRFYEKDNGKLWSENYHIELKKDKIETMIGEEKLVEPTPIRPGVTLLRQG